MLFLFSKNPDGSYYIIPRNLKETFLVEVINAGIQNGDNIQIWVPTNHPCQLWKINKISEKEEEKEELKEANLNIVKIETYKDKDCVHTVVFTK